MSDPIDDALSIIFAHPGPWSEEMRARMAKVINATLEWAAALADECGERWEEDGRLSGARGAFDVAAEIRFLALLDLPIPESNSTNAGEG